MTESDRPTQEFIVSLPTDPDLCKCRRCGAVGLAERLERHKCNDDIEDEQREEALVAYNPAIEAVLSKDSG